MEVKIPAVYEKAFLKYLERYLEGTLDEPQEKSIPKVRSWNCHNCGYWVLTKGNSHKEHWHCSLYSCSCASGITCRWIPKE